MKKLLIPAIIALAANITYATATFDIQVNGWPWDGSAVWQGDILTVAFCEDQQGYGYLELITEFSAGEIIDGEVWGADFDFIPFDYWLEPLTGGGFYLGTLGCPYPESPSPVGVIWQLELLIPYGLPSNSRIVIDPYMGRWNGVEAATGPEDSFPYVVIDVAAGYEMYVDAGGDYLVEAGGGVTLDAGGSYITYGWIERYNWDLDGGGSYDLSSMQPQVEVTCDYLAKQLGLYPGWHTIQLCIEGFFYAGAEPPEPIGGCDNAQLFISPVPNAIYVDDDAPADPAPGDPNISDPLEDGEYLHPFDSIREAIDVASESNTVIVFDGTYTGPGNRDISFAGKNITVSSFSGPDDCIINCQGAAADEHIAFIFDNEEGPDAVIDGFTITGAVSHSYGAAVYCAYSSPTIRNCRIIGNLGLAAYGGGICCIGSGPVISDSTIRGNYPDGIYLQNNSEARIRQTVRFINSDITGSGSGDFGSLVVDTGATLHVRDVNIIDCTVSGGGTMYIPAGDAVIIGGSSVVQLDGFGDPNAQGAIDSPGLLVTSGGAQLWDTNIDVALARFTGNSVVSGNTIFTKGVTPYSQIIVADNALVTGNLIYANGDRYIDIDPATFSGRIHDNQIYITASEGQSGTDPGIFECRGRDFFCSDPNCAPGIFPLELVPDSEPNTWTLERLELLEGANLRLANRFDYQYPYDLGGDSEVVYVRELVLGPNSILDTSFNRLYYEALQWDGTAEVVNKALRSHTLNGISLDDVNEFDIRVTGNNFFDPDLALSRVHVQFVTGRQPDPNGMMLMSNLVDNDPASQSYGQLLAARAKTIFARTIEDPILVQFRYMFSTSEPGAELVVYLSDIPGILPHDHPDFDEHYLEVGVILAPPPGRPGSAGSGRFGYFGQKVSPGHLDMSGGIWLELELTESAVGGILMSPPGEEGSSSGASVYVDDCNPMIVCHRVCLDINFDRSPDEIDYLMFIGELGHTAVDDRECVDGVFTDDGYVDFYDVAAWDWAMSLDDPQRLNCCRVPLVEEGEAASVNIDVGLEGAVPELPVGSLPSNLTDLLIAGKRGTAGDAGKLKDRFYVFDRDGLCRGYSVPSSERYNLKLIQDPDGNLYMLNCRDGIVEVGGSGSVIVPPDDIELADMNEPRYDKSATVYIGLQSDTEDAVGRPVLDAVFDGDYIYVVPVIVQPDGNDPYAAVAKLHLKDQGSPPYDLVQLFDDPPLPGDNQYRNALREVELDDSGNLYVINADSRNESDILFRFEPNGTAERVELGKADCNCIPAPLAMTMCSGADMLYLASARSRTAEPNSVSIYGFSTEGTLTLKRSVTIEGIGHVTGIAEDPGTCSLWIAGFSMEAPEWPTPGEEPFYSPRLAVLPADSNDAQLMDIEDSDSHDLALPMSVIWTRRCGGADLSGDGGVDFDDFAELASRFLAESGQGRYDIDCDLTSPADGTIDFKDLLTFTNFWLHTGCAD